MPLNSLTTLLELLSLGLLAGFEIGVHYGLGAPPLTLQEDAQILLRQVMVRRLRILAPLIFFPTLLFTTWVTLQGRSQPRSWFQYMAVTALLLWVVIRAVRTVPVNSATLEWNAAKPPKDWRTRIERTERSHVLAAWGAVVAFVCALVSTFMIQ